MVGCKPLKLATRVRIPLGSYTRGFSGNGSTLALQVESRGPIPLTSKELGLYVNFTSTTIVHTDNVCTGWIR